MKGTKATSIAMIAIALVVVIAGATFAWFTWNSGEGEETEIGFVVQGLTDETITSEDEDGNDTLGAEASITGADLYPTQTKEEGIIKTFTLTKTIDVYMRADFTLILDTFPTGLAHESFKWVLTESTTEGETQVGTGDFDGKVQGNEIALATNLELTTTGNTYKLYLWIDGANYDNPTAMQGQDFSFTLRVDATDEPLATQEP